MIHITNAQADRLARLLDETSRELRASAGHHIYRYDAMRFVGERGLAQYHKMCCDCPASRSWQDFLGVKGGGGGVGQA